MSGNDELSEKLTELLTLKLQKPVTAAKITLLIANGVKYLGKVKSLSGPQKKNLVLKVVREVIRTSDAVPDDKRDQIIELVDMIGDPTVDVLVDFALDSATFIHKKCSKLCKCTCGKPETEEADTRAIDEEYNQIKAFLQLKFQRPVSPTKIVLMVAAGVKFAARFQSISGPEKKATVIRALRDLINETDLVTDEDLRKVLIEYLDTFADLTIDYLVEFGRTQYLKIKKGCKGCC